MALADRIAIMNDGVLQQVGSPSEVYLRPANLFVAQFVGSPVMNIVKGDVRPAGTVSRVSIAPADASFEFPAALHPQIAAKVDGGGLTVGVRPEAVFVSRDDRPGYIPVEAHIIEPLGAYDIVDLKVGGEMLRARTASGFVRRVGDTVWARLDPEQTHFFNTATGESLNIRLGGGNGAHPV
jgi:multiple sugar transport system ATP-binding protein